MQRSFYQAPSEQFLPRNLQKLAHDTPRYQRVLSKSIRFILSLSYLLRPQETRCAYVVLLMGGYWVTECVPIGIVSLIPVVLFPLFGILSTNETCVCYMNDTIMVFVGGLILAIATEHCNLHLRIALVVMKTLGCSHARLLGGLCIVTTFISMWIANAATAAMMVPIVLAVLYELEKVGALRGCYTSKLPRPDYVDYSRRKTPLHRVSNHPRIPAAVSS